MRAAVFGAGGAIGRAFVEQLVAAPTVTEVFAFSRRDRTWDSPKVRARVWDAEQEASIASAAAECRTGGDIDLVLVASGVLHDAANDLQPEKTWRSLRADTLARAFAVNAIGPALVARHFLELLPADRKGVFAALSARVGSIEDNRLGGWYAYRASKAALHMLIRTLSVELARRNRHALCVALHPGTVDSVLSEPFQGGVAPGKLFAPEFAAARLLAVLDQLSPAASGQVFAWDGQRIPF